MIKVDEHVAYRDMVRRIVTCNFSCSKPTRTLTGREARAR